jgi:hypothetical protein
MTHIETYFETQYSTVEEPNYWRTIGERFKSYTEISKQTRELASKEENNIKIHAFRIIECGAYMSIEEIKRFPIDC